MPIKTNLKSLEPSSARLKQQIQLLSRGYSDPKTFPGGMITVYPWDTEISAWMATERSLQPGRLLYALTSRLTGLTDAQVRNFVAGEVSLVLLVARAIANDQTISFTARCPYCGTTERCSVNVPEKLGKVGEKPEGYQGWDTINLPVCKDVLKVRPLLVSDEIAISERIRDASRREPSDTGARMIASILEINGGAPDSREELVQYYFALSPQDLQAFNDELDRITPHLDTALHQECPSCKRTFIHELSFDEEFFRPSRR